MNIYQIFKLLYRDRAFNPNPKLPPKSTVFSVCFLPHDFCVYLFCFKGLEIENEGMSSMIPKSLNE